MKNPILLSVINFAIIAILAFYFLIPKYQDLSYSNMQAELRVDRLKNLQEHFSELSSLDQELSAYQAEMAKVQSALPEDPSLASVFYFFQESAKQNGLLLTSISFSSTKREQANKEKTEIKEDIFSVEVTGSYTAFKNFLSTVERSARLIEIESISFSSKKEEESVSKDLFSFELSVKVYSYMALSN